jgi:tRNA-(ms[2]io[6]A)-hydroxylase
MLNLSARSLNLCAPTRPSWIHSALDRLDDLLLDHAHCEKKAAGMALKLLFSYPQHCFLQEPLSRLAREELGHFEQVLQRLEDRRVAFGRQRPSAYGGRLHALVRPSEPQRLIDLLLVAAIIEARSCERFKLLADSIVDPELAKFYGGLLVCEARHHALYVDLAMELESAAEVRRRLAELAACEARILAEPAHDVRIHS